MLKIIALLTIFLSFSNSFASKETLEEDPSQEKGIPISRTLTDEKENFQNPFQVLPDEVLIQITNFLDNRHLSFLERVCKDFYLKKPVLWQDRILNLGELFLNDLINNHLRPGIYNVSIKIDEAEYRYLRVLETFKSINLELLRFSWRPGNESEPTIRTLRLKALKEKEKFVTGELNLILEQGKEELEKKGFYEEIVALKSYPPVFKKESYHELEKKWEERGETNPLVKKIVSLLKDNLFLQAELQYFQKLEKFQTSNVQFPVFKVLPQLTNITALNYKPDYSYLGFEHITKLQSLTELKLASSYIKDEDVHHLASLTNLRSLTVIEEDKTKEGNNKPFSPYGKLTNLRILDLGNYKSSRLPELNHLSTLVSLTYLDLSGALWYKEGEVASVSFLKELANLRHLGLSGSKTTLSGSSITETLPYLTKLIKLCISHANVTLDTIHSLSGLTQLEWVQMDGDLDILDMNKIQQNPEDYPHDLVDPRRPWPRAFDLNDAKLPLKKEALDVLLKLKNLKKIGL